jgi:hypothetical protein
MTIHIYSHKLKLICLQMNSVYILQSNHSKSRRDMTSSHFVHKVMLCSMLSTFLQKNHVSCPSDRGAPRTGAQGSMARDVLLGPVRHTDSALCYFYFDPGDLLHQVAPSDSFPRRQDSEGHNAMVPPRWCARDSQDYCPSLRPDGVTPRRGAGGSSTRSSQTPPASHGT